jgi:hypothetical protein
LSQRGVLALVVGTLACATTQVEREPIANTSTATLRSEDTKIDELDGQAFTLSLGATRRRFELSPGRHELGVSVLVVASGPEADASDFKRSGVRVMCFDAQSGHAYLTRPAPRGRRNVPELFDLSTGQVLAGSCDESDAATRGVEPAPEAVPGKRAFGCAPQETGRVSPRGVGLLSRAGAGDGRRRVDRPRRSGAR